MRRRTQFSGSSDFDGLSPKIVMTPSLLSQSTSHWLRLSQLAAASMSATSTVGHDAKAIDWSMAVRRFSFMGLTIGDGAEGVKKKIKNIFERE